MEHIVQFAIGIDDAVIRKRIEESAYDDILDKIVKEAKETIRERGGFPKSNWDRLVDEAIRKEVDRFCEKNREDIIERSAEKLCESYKRTKAYKEKMAEVMEVQTIPPIIISEEK